MTGDLLDSEAEALVNPVNCVGVMGKGLARQFARAYPRMLEDYRRRCQAGELRLGEVVPFRERGKWVVNLPTKGHWRQPSKLADIEAGLVGLQWFLRICAVPSVAVPQLGCGNGGLAWSDVRPLIEATLGGAAYVEVYGPPPG